MIPTGAPARRALAVVVSTLSVCAASLLAGCASGGGGPAGTSAPPAGVPVVASTNVYGAVVRAVGGDRVRVDSIINEPTADPHSYESTPADAAKVSAAKLVVLNGGGYDDFMSKLVASAGTQPKVIDAVTVSGLNPDSGAGAEHVWYSLDTIEKLAAQVAADLGALDATGNATYAANLAAFNGQVDGLRAKVDAIKAAHSGARVAATEPVSGYLLEVAGLTDTTPPAFVEAVEAETDPPAATLNEMQKLFQAPDPVRALVVNPQTETPVTTQVEQAATAGNVPVVQMSETIPPSIADYQTWMGQQIDALAGALNRR
jgi:zinc/manganese transport system substrate-binding protein